MVTRNDNAMPARPSAGRRQAVLALCAAAFGGAAGRAGAAQLDPKLPDYVPQPVAPPKNAGYLLPDGTVHIVSANRGIGVVIRGFNSLFEKTHPGVRFLLSDNHHGNSLNMATLTHDKSLVAPLGRHANLQERTTYRRIVGADPMVVNFAHGTLVSQRMTAGLAVYINKANPIQNLTMDQLARIFTTGQPGGDLTHWGQLGATGDWAMRPIHTYGTPEWSGYGYFMLKHRWNDRPYAPDIETFDLAAQITNRVGEDLYAIGFAGQGFLTPQTRLVGLAETAAGPFMTGTEEEVATGRYPLDRRVGFAVRRLPGKPLDPFVKEYLRLALSRQGQEIVISEADGYVPLNAEQVAEERAKLDETT